jgi:hypothetical protein
LENSAEEHQAARAERRDCGIRHRGGQVPHRGHGHDQAVANL